MIHSHQNGTPWKRWLNYLKYRMLRQKEMAQNDMKTELRRCLNTIQLTMLGVGSTIGVGIYVLLGVVAKENAGMLRLATDSPYMFPVYFRICPFE